MLLDHLEYEAFLGHQDRGRERDRVIMIIQYFGLEVTCHFHPAHCPHSLVLVYGVPRERGGSHDVGNQKSLPLEGNLHNLLIKQFQRRMIWEEPSLSLHISSVPF